MEIRLAVESDKDALVPMVNEVYYSSEQDFWKVIDSWRSPHIWEKLADNEWKLKNPIWADKQNEN